MKVLYVEDNDDNIFMLRNRLNRAGYDVVVATDGLQGVAAAAAEQPDLILMDLSCPDSTAGRRRAASRRRPKPDTFLSSR